MFIKTYAVHFTVYSFDFLNMKEKDKLYTFKSFSQEALKDMNVNKEQLAKEMGIQNLTFDYALPQNWLDQFVDDHCPKGVDRNDYYALVRSTSFATYIDCTMYIISGCVEVQNQINKGTIAERMRLEQEERDLYA